MDDCDETPSASSSPSSTARLSDDGHTAIHAHLDGCIDCLQAFDFHAELRRSSPPSAATTRCRPACCRASSSASTRLRRRRPHRLTPARRVDTEFAADRTARYAGPHDSRHLPLLARRDPARRFDPGGRRPDRWLPQEGHGVAVPARSGTGKSKRVVVATAESPIDWRRAEQIATHIAGRHGGADPSASSSTSPNHPAPRGPDRRDHRTALAGRAGDGRGDRPAGVDPRQHHLVPSTARPVHRASGR